MASDAAKHCMPCSQADDIHDLKAAVFGNGKEGLKSLAVRHDERLKNVEKKQDDMMILLRMIAAGVAVAVIVAVLQLI